MSAIRAGVSSAGLERWRLIAPTRRRTLLTRRKVYRRGAVVTAVDQVGDPVFRFWVVGLVNDDFCGHTWCLRTNYLPATNGVLWVRDG